MTNTQDGKKLIKALEDRFTCKRYDPNGRVSNEDFKLILEAARRNMTANSEWAHYISSDVEGLDDEALSKKLEKFDACQRNELRVAESARTLFDWAGKQTYIALSNMLTAAAVLGVNDKTMRIGPKTRRPLDKVVKWVK